MKSFSEYLTFESARDAITETDRVITTNQFVTGVRRVTQNPANRFKPEGLWYGIGASWIDYIESEMPDRLGKYLFQVAITPKVMQLTTVKQIKEFDAKYGIEKHGMAWIDWIAVSKVCSGIEISPYQWSLRFDLNWYYSWDVASGCIWDPSGISKITQL